MRVVRFHVGITAKLSHQCCEIFCLRICSKSCFFRQSFGACRAAVLGPADAAAEGAAAGRTLGAGGDFFRGKDMEAL